MIDGEALQEIAFAANDARSRYVKVLRLIKREMAQACDVYERDILNFIVERTHAFGKSQEMISESHFLEGVFGREGECVCPRVAMGRTKLYNAIENLIKNRMIVRIPGKNDRSAPSYMINTEWGFANISKGNGMAPHLKRSSKSATRSNRSATRSNMSVIRTNRSASRTAISTDKSTDSEPSVEQAPTAADTIRSKLNDIASSTKARRDAKKETGSATAILKSWEDAWKLTYPDDPYFTPVMTREVVPLRNALNRGNVPNEKRAEFVAWAVSNFGLVMRTHYSFMKNTRLPNMSFLAKYCDVFYRAYTDADDPNRKVDRRIRDALEKRVEPAENKTKLNQQETTTSGERITDDATANTRETKAIVRRKFVNRLVLKRKSRSEEFGEWGD